MADKKISALTASATPLAGTEVLPIVQSGATVKVAVSDLTAGRAMSATQLTLTTENLIIGTAGKGIDFSAATHAAGMTSELLDDYEEGTFTPSDVSGAGLSFSNAIGFYTKVGQVVTCHMQFQYPATADGSQARISLPFISINSTAPGGGVFYVNTSPGIAGAQPNVTGNQTYIILSNVAAGTAYLNLNASGCYFRGTIIYNTTA
jgi:hypothetical protein